MTRRRFARGGELPSEDAGSPCRAPIARAIRRIGILPLVAVFSLCAGAVLHAVFFPGAGYTWLRPAEILLMVVASAHIPVLALCAFVLGFVTRLERGFPRTVRELPCRMSMERRRAGWACAASIAATTLAALLFPEHTFADLLTLGAASFAIAMRRPAPGAAVRFALEIALVVGLLVCVSYAFTVVKALLFRFGTPQDLAIISIERALTGVTPHRSIAAWAARNPWNVWLSDRVYYLFFQHMLLVSIFLVGTGRRRERMQYLGALAFVYVIGGLSYHLWPALGPAFADPAPYRAILGNGPTATASFQRFLAANTARAAAGSADLLHTYEYVACMPSLHLAHELVMLH